MIDPCQDLPLDSDKGFPVSGVVVQCLAKHLIAYLIKYCPFAPQMRTNSKSFENKCCFPEVFTAIEFEDISALKDVSVQI